MPCAKIDVDNFNLASKWRAAQKLADLFWKRWTTEYMPFLIKRPKWHEDTTPIKLNDIVIIVDPNGLRNLWPKGQVIQIYPGRDQRIRTVDVKLANGSILRRPVSRLCVLDLDKKNNE